jgi:hypothetical protein
LYLIDLLLDVEILRGETLKELEEVLRGEDTVRVLVEETEYPEIDET